jgi:phospholipid/cholesterol/gamma-HCH transport system permease protein
MTGAIAGIGGRLVWAVHDFGVFGRFAWAAIVASFWSGLGWRRPRLLLPQLFSVGTKSIPVVMLVGGFVGAVLGVEGFDQFAAIGQEDKLGGVISVSVVKQIGPVLAAVMIAGRVGGSVSAELGTMRVTEQIDAIDAMGVDPVRYLVMPRVCACLIMVPILTIFSDLTGVFGGWLVIVRGYGVDNGAYWQFSRDFIGNYEVMIGLAKAAVFGLAIGLIACFKGFYCRPGAAGVGRASTDAFVISFIAIIIANFFLAAFFNSLRPILIGNEGINAFGG